MTQETRKIPKCAECGMELESWDEFHAIEACVLFRAGFDPRQFVADYLRFKAERTDGRLEGQ